MNPSTFNLNLAVVIGINDYGNGIPSLGTAKEDAEAIAAILEQDYHYQVELLTDNQATGQALKHWLETELPKSLEKDNPSRLVFYFAGHGIALNGDDGPQGYLIPQDAKLGDAATYLPMQQVEVALTKLSCRHCLVILDCCFAGAFRWSSTRKLVAISETIHKERFDRFIKDPAWQVITSAASDQFALDNLDLNSDRRIAKANSNHSPFAAALMEALGGGADAYPPAKNGQPSGDGIITATELYLYLRDAVEVPTDARNQRQTPQIWCLKKHDKGEFIFLPPGHELNLPPAPILDNLEENNPYRGLKSYETKDSDLFFGRTSLIEKLCHTVSDRPLTVVLGASGSGKSSLVKAGLIPSLSLNRVYQWHSLSPIRPGESPLNSLNTVLKELGNVTTEQVNSQIFIKTITVWSKANPQTKLLLVVDQLEELITLCRNDEEKQQFLEILATLINTFPDVVRLVVTLRSDFEPQLRNTPLESLWQAGRFVVPAMTREELRSVIEEPASAKVVYFESLDDPDKGYLVDRLIDEVAGMPGALPLLSFALSELYLKLVRRYLEAQNDGDTVERAITWADYDALGGVTKSLTQRADEIYEELVKVDPAYEKTIRNVMLRMVAVGGELARRQVLKTELEYPAYENKRVELVLKQFGEARLLTSNEDEKGRTYIEPSHDALIRGWEKLLSWKKKEEENLILQQRLTPAADEWNRKHETHFLWDTNPRLGLLQHMIKSTDNWLNKIEVEFVRRSVQQKRKNTTIRWSLIISAFIGLIGFTSFIYIQSLITQIRASNSSSKASYLANQELIALQESLISGEQLKQIQRFWPVDAETQLQTKLTFLQAISGTREYNQFEGNTPINDIQISNDGKILAGAGEDGTIKLWILATNEVKILKGHKIGIIDISFSPDNHTFVSASRDGTIKHWTIEGKLLQTIQTDEIGNIGFSTDGQKIISNHGQKLRFWNLDGTLSKSIRNDISSILYSDPNKALNKLFELWKFNRNLSEFFSIDSYGGNRFASSPNGKILATIKLMPNVLEIRSRKDGKLLRSVSDLVTDRGELGDGSFVVRFSPDSNKIALANNSSTIQIWNVDGELLDTLNGHRDLVTSLSFHPDGQTLASSSRDGAIKLWRLTRNNLTTLSKPKTYYDSLIFFSPDSQIIASTGGNGDHELVTFWTKDGKWLQDFQNNSHVTFSPDNLTAAVYSFSSESAMTTQLWNRDSGQIKFLEGRFENFSPDGNIVITTLNSNTLKLWANDGSFINSINGKKAYFSPDNQTIISMDDHGVLRFWRDDGTLIRKKTYNQIGFVGSPRYYNFDIAFSPDSQKIAISSTASNTTQLLTKSGETFQTLKGDRVSFSPNSELIATFISSKDQAIVIWDKNGKYQKSLPYTQDSIGTTIMFSPDSQILVASNSDIATFWNKNGDFLFTTVGSFVFNVDSKAIFSANSNSSEIKIWNQNGALLENITHNDKVKYLNLSPDGQLLTLVDDTGKIVLWNLGLDSLLNHGCRWLYDYLNNPNANFSNKNPNVSSICSKK